MRCVIAFLVGVLGLADLRGQDEPVLYYPTRVGTKWTYQSKGKDTTYVVTDVENKAGAYLVTVGVVGADGMVTPYEKVDVSAKGVYLVADVEVRLIPDGAKVVVTEGKLVPETPPLCLLKLPAKAGERWDARPDQTHPVRHTTGRPEAAKVPAGTYTAVPVDAEYVLPPGYPTLRDRCWYAPGVGKVKWVDASGNQGVLKSFISGKD